MEKTWGPHANMSETVGHRSEMKFFSPAGLGRSSDEPDRSSEELWPSPGRLG